MRRETKHLFEDNQGADRWLISYADFITLLFAFFVVMYSISQVNENKYKILSTSLEKAFDNQPTSNDPIQIGNFDAKSVSDLADENTPPRPSSESEDIESGKIDSENFASSEEFKQLENGLKESLGDLIDQDLAEIKSDVNWINITLRSGLLFPSGSDALNEGADPLLEEVSKQLNANNQLLIVHGHTDNIAIDTERFPSNWELSSARAVAVVRKLQNLSVYAPRMAIEGHGEFKPIAPNDSAENRAKNRRVVISISRKKSVAGAPEVENDTKDGQIESETAIEQNANLPAQEKETEPQFEIVRLPNGEIVIRGKTLPQNEAENNNE